MFMKNSLFLVLSLFYYLLLCYLYSLSNDHLFYIKSDFFCLFFSVSTTEIINKDIGIVQTNQNESQTQISDQKQFFHSDKIINVTLSTESPQSIHIYYSPPKVVLPPKPTYPSYYYPRIGVLYSQLPNVTSISFSPLSFFVVGSSHISLISSLPDKESNTLSEIYTSRSTWKTRFSSIQSEVHNASITNNYQCPVPPHDSQYSTIHLWRNPSAGSRSLYGTNLCYKPNTAEIFIFLPPNESLNRTIIKDAFFWGWTLRELHYPIRFPTSSRTGVAIVFPPFNNHIYHAMEAVGQVLHKAFSAEEYPYVREVINSGFSRSDVPWIQEMIRLLFKSFHFLRNPPLYTGDTVYSHPSMNNHIMCFDSVLFMDRMKQGGDGGFFTGYLGTDWMKGIVYKHYYISLSNKQTNKYLLLFAQRTNSRKWRNPEQIVRHLSSRYNDTLIIQNFYYTSSPLKHQLQSFYQADILLTPHGAGTTNCIFMLPHSVVIEVMPPHFSELPLAGVILHARLHYIYVSNFDYSVLAAYRLPSPDDAYKRGEYLKMRGHYKSLDLTNNPFSITSAVDDAIAFLDHTRYKIVNDYLSPLFI